MSRDYMPIMAGMDYQVAGLVRAERKAGNHFLVISVPWGMIEAHEKQALTNHGQTLEKLASRGGLSPCEALAILEDRPWRKMTQANAILAAKLTLWLEVQSRNAMTPEELEELGDSLTREAYRRSAAS